MCGILAILNARASPKLRQRAFACACKLNHRGPDWSGVYSEQQGQKQHVLCHERLAIVDVDSGAQPLFNEDKSIVLVANGEIYNHKTLAKEKLKQEHTFRTQSDCEIILHLYEEYGADFVDMLSGDFAFVLLDSKKQRVVAARDPAGVVPLYMGRCNTDGSVWLASELKAIIGQCDVVDLFKPGYTWQYDMTKDEGEEWRYYRPAWLLTDKAPTVPCNLVAIREAFEAAVKKRMMCDVPYGVLLSGGLDSSLVASCVVRHANMRVESGDKETAWWPQVHTFSVGLKGSPDLKAAQVVADYLKTKHHGFEYTVQQGIDAIPRVIYHLESYDVTTVRSSTPMYLMARRIRSMGVKMVLSGEGSDEIFAGYLYFAHAKDAQELHDETKERFRNLHYSDCLRANKSMMAWGVEPRVPFLDRDFLAVAMGFDPRDKMFDPKTGLIEKNVLRKAFDDTTYLPDSILWRQKEQFSDGVGYSWVDELRAHAEKHVSDGALQKAAERFPVNTPTTKEAYWYREIYASHFPAHGDHLVKKWIPTWGQSKDPSGRVQVTHVQHESF